MASEVQVTKVEALIKEADYDVVIAKLFNDLVSKQGNQRSYPFKKDEIMEALEELKAAGKVRHIRNIPDIKYTYDARRDFPNQILKTGFWGIVGAGKSKYRFERIPQNNLIRVPKDIAIFNPKRTKVPDRTAKMVSAVLGRDEQATMTRLRYNDIVSKFLNMESYQVQGHERTTVTCGQIEVDEVYVGTAGGKKFIVPISAKGGDKDCLSYTQALNLALYAREKKRFAGYIPTPLGVLRTANGDVYMVRFNAPSTLAEVKIEEVAIYELT